jgi:hypothetical protein
MNGNWNLVLNLQLRDMDHMLENRVTSNIERSEILTGVSAVLISSSVLASLVRKQVKYFYLTWID